jgi:C4-dicarboxylate-specific signal transduction histidine kinase
MGEMAAGLAHEVNQPLGAIVNYAGGCLEKLAPAAEAADQVRDKLEEIIAEAMRASEVIRRIRRYVRRTEPVCSREDINGLVLEVIRMAVTETRGHGIAYCHELALPLPLVVADSIQIEQVILNLVRNGFEAMAETEPGNRRLILETSVTDDHSVMLAVRDAGHGFNGQDVHQMFQPFFTTKPQGLGMGLAISRSIIEAHGGRLWGTLNPGRGATFQFTLPIPDEAKPQPK